MLYDVCGNAYVDYVCALGTNILGYANPHITHAVTKQLEAGTLFSLPHRKEIELAEKIKSMFPSIDLLRFLKSGSEAVSAGIKIARAFTGKDIVLSNGYHGWHDWSTPITGNREGTPRSFDDTILSFNYNDIDGLKTLFSNHVGRVACVVIDPYVFDEPANDFLGKLIKLSHKYGALVLFDEVVTGIRWHKFGVQNHYGLKPDLTALGKGLANGLPISCIGGRKSVMKVLDGGCFVSSTYGGDLVGIAGALANLEIVTSDNVPEMLYESGLQLQDGLNELGIKCVGSPLRQKMVFESEAHKALFWQECVKRGVFFGGAQHTSASHNNTIIEKTLDVCSEALKICKLYSDNPKKALEGEIPKPVLAISNLRK